ncbi:MAG: hypothetical protein HYT76_01640 [Deltaproteobacteria bacterium]|nr:hypothetical protein [Deltaproteobacteria bacterium]
MKKFFFVLIATSLFLPVSLRAGSLDYKTLGVGLEIGEPIGLNGRYFFTDQIAFDLTVGYAPIDGIIEFTPSALVYLRRIFEMDGSGFTLIPYFGGGMRTGPGVARLHDGEWFGAFRIPIGAAVVIGDGTFEITAEMGHGFEFTPHTVYDVTGTLGLRYYLW